MIERMIRAARLDPHLYEEVEADSTLLPQAVGVVIIVSLATGIGTLATGILGLLLGIVVSIVSWAIWAWIVYFVGTRLLPAPQTHADWGQVARGTGFAQSPGILSILGFVPFLGAIAVLVASVWQIVAMVVAIRQALDYESTLRAVGVVIIGFIPVLILDIILAVILERTA